MNSFVEILPQRKREVIDLAEYISQEYSTIGPIEPHIIASANSIRVIYNRYAHYFDGVLFFNGERFFIYCNLDKSGGMDTPRARFTLSHELGHYFIDEHRNILRSGKTLHHGSSVEYSSHNIVEQEADLFASHLLMPSVKFNAEIQRKRALKGIAEILYLKNVFRTSIMSTSIRFVSAEIIPCAIFIWNNDGSLKWHRKSVSFIKSYIGSPIQSISVLRGSATQLAFQSSEESIFASGGTVSTYFTNVAPGNYRNAILKEESIRLGEHGVLTFLSTDGTSLVYDDF